MSDSQLSKRIREIIAKAAKAADEDMAGVVGSLFQTRTVLTAKCRACGQKNRWSDGRPAKCGKCGFPLPEAPVQ